MCVPLFVCRLVLFYIALFSITMDIRDYFHRDNLWAECLIYMCVSTWVTIYQEVFEVY